jgi:electron transport complex protein RnfD
MKPIISLSPHVHGGDSVQRNMYGVCMALLPALAASLWFFGLGAAIVMLTSVASCVFFEWAIAKFILKRERITITDGSAVLTGMLLGFNLPSNLPIWIIIIGALVAIGIGKMTFGGLGCNPFNPALAGRIFLLISFPVQMTSWPEIKQYMAYTDATTAATPLSLMQTAIATGDASVLEQLPSLEEMLLGAMGGSLGEVSALMLLLGTVFMLWKKIITWHIPVSILGTVAVFSTALHLWNPAYAHPLAVLMSGGLILGACFMATDYVTSPMSHRGQLIYGVCIGLLTVVASG